MTSVISTCPLCKNECVRFDGICAGSSSVASMEELETKIKCLVEDIFRFLGFVSDDPIEFMRGTLTLQTCENNIESARKSKGSRVHPYNAKGMRTFGYVCQKTLSNAMQLPLKKRLTTSSIPLLQNGFVYEFNVKTFIQEATARYGLVITSFDERDIRSRLKPLFFRHVE